MSGDVKTFKFEIPEFLGEWSSQISSRNAGNREWGWDSEAQERKRQAKVIFFQAVWTFLLEFGERKKTWNSLSKKIPPIM